MNYMLLLQRELAGRLHAEVAALSERAAADAASWAERCEGLRQALAAQQAHTAALEAQLSSRPTTQQVICSAVLCIQPYWM